MAALSSVLTFEDKCPQSPEELEIERETYFNWADTYQNPLSEAYKNIKSVPVSRSILFHVAFKNNWSLRVLAQDPTHQLSNDDIILPGADLKLDSDFSYNLSQQVDLTKPYYYDYITLAIKAPGHQVNPDGFFDVFSSDLLLWLLLSAVISTGVIHAVSFSFITCKCELNFLQSLAFILKNFILQDHNLKAPKPAVQVFASVWALGAFVTSTVYLSVVVSSVLSPDAPPATPETLEDIVKVGMRPTTVIWQYKDVINYLDRSEQHDLQKLARNMSTVDYIVNCLDAAVRDPRIACVAKFRGMQSLLQSKYKDKQGNPRILISKYRSSVIRTGYAVRKKSPFGEILSSFIGRTAEAGLLDYWTSIKGDDRRRWGIGMKLGDRCSNQPHLFYIWHKIGKEANKHNPNKHIRECFRWNLTDYKEIVKKHCTKIESGGVGNSSPLDSMIRLEHLLIVFGAMLVWYSLAFVCLILEFACGRIFTSFRQHILVSGLSCVRSLLACMKVLLSSEIYGLWQKWHRIKFTGQQYTKKRLHHENKVNTSKNSATY